MVDHLLFIGGDGNKARSEFLARLHIIREGATTLADKFGTTQGSCRVYLSRTTQV